MAEGRVLRRLAGVGVAVPSPDETAAFLTDVLDFASSSNGTGSSDGTAHRELTVDGDYGLGPPRRLLTLSVGDGPALTTLVFEATDAGLDELARRLEARDMDAERLDDGGLRFEPPFGPTVECLPSAVRLDDPLPPSNVRPRNLSHVNVKVPDPPAAVEFFGEVLGLRLSEDLDGRFFFMRVGSLHHDVGLRPGAASADLHHLAFEVEGWQSFLTICDHLASLGHQVEYGPGRHAPGHSLFVYLREPSSGLRLELCADMAVIDDVESFETIRRGIDRMKSVNVWGPAPPESFLD